MKKLSFTTHGDEQSSVESGTSGYVRITTAQGVFDLTKEALRIIAAYVKASDELESYQALYGNDK